jgi:hypothetical protein
MQRHAGHIDGPAQLRAVIAEIEIEFAIGTKDKRVQIMIVISLSAVFEQNLAPVRFVVAIGVGQNKDVGRTGNDDLVSKDTNTQRGVDGGVLIEGFDAIAAPSRFESSE